MMLAALGSGCSDEHSMRYRVASRSMEPTLKLGEIVISVPYSADPKVGDIVLIEHPDYSAPLIHRIGLIDGAYIQTKGDANKLYDKAVHKSAIIGQVFKIEETKQ